MEKQTEKNKGIHLKSINQITIEQSIQGKSREELVEWIVKYSKRQDLYFKIWNSLFFSAILVILISFASVLVEENKEDAITRVSILNELCKEKNLGEYTQSTVRPALILVECEHESFNILKLNKKEWLY